jgi:hypothetical protein
LEFSAQAHFEKDRAFVGDAFAKGHVKGAIRMIEGKPIPDRHLGTSGKDETGRIGVKVGENERGLLAAMRPALAGGSVSV